MTHLYRTDLSNRSMIVLMLGLLALLLILALWPALPPPGSLTGQVSAIAGGLCLLGPAMYTVIKRGESTRNPTLWFVIHVLSAIVGSFFVAIHVASGHWWSPPGIVLACLVWLVIQGCVMRVLLTRHFSRLFARNTREGGFSAGIRPDREKIRQLITDKTRLLSRLDAKGCESLFSPALRHWLKHPLLCLHYQMLAEEEALHVGARATAPFILRWARRLHLYVAALFFAGLLIHVITVTFFAGYVAGEGNISWWYLADWGRPE